MHSVWAGKSWQCVSGSLPLEVVFQLRSLSTRRCRHASDLISEHLVGGGLPLPQFPVDILVFLSLEFGGIKEAKSVVYLDIDTWRS